MLTGNRDRSLRAISARIHSMSNTHNGNAGNLVTSKNGTLNGSSTTPTRQQRSMNIHNTKRRHMQHLIRQNAAIGSHTENISLRSLECINYLRRHTIGLNNRQPQLKRLGLNRRRLQLFTTPTNSIGTSNDKHNLVPSPNKRSQRRHSKIRRTHKHNTHKERLPSTKAETATNNGGKPSTQHIRNNNSTRTNIPKTKERAAIKAALPTKQLSAKTPIPGPRHPGEPGHNNAVPGAERPHIIPCSNILALLRNCARDDMWALSTGDGGIYSVSPGRAPRARASWYSLTALSLCMGLRRSNMVLPCR